MIVILSNIAIDIVMIRLKPFSLIKSWWQRFLLEFELYI